MNSGDRSIMKHEKYACQQCGCDEFISQLNQYDIFKAEDAGLVFQSSERTNDKVELFCRDCSKKTGIY